MLFIYPEMLKRQRDRRNPSWPDCVPVSVVCLFFVETPLEVWEETGKKTALCFGLALCGLQVFRKH